MIFNQIKKDIYYVGVNDRTTDRFEAMWPLPYGVSYNSYFIADRKTAVIDSVEVSRCMRLVSHIRELGHELDYIVVNHMEPDHSGSLPILLAEFPEAKIVGNAKTIDMVKGYYGIADADRLMVVADGDTLCLGQRTLRFILTPMVHWPETMMTYIEGEGVLFTGDAFGTFGALHGACLDSKIDDTDLYLREMYRYYASIVGKYGQPVQRALAKVNQSNVTLDLICPTHGPVWHDKISEVVSIYDRLSRYEAERGVVIAYGSMYGNTAEAAEHLAVALSEAGERHIRVFDLASDDLSFVLADAFRYDTLVVASPTYSMQLFPRVEALMRALQTREVKGRRFAYLAAHTWAPAVPKALDAFVQTLGWETLGSVGFKQAATDVNLTDIEMLAKTIVARK